MPIYPIRVHCILPPPTPVSLTAPRADPVCLPTLTKPKKSTPFPHPSASPSKRLVFTQPSASLSPTLPSPTLPRKVKYSTYTHTSTPRR
ncbi:hypothetical protein IQ07DRAFT_286283 [Pyrenochaeta sp. DS3sAY3a]|nr:hypothetical protein IQ07DRAFT_286283 [Pyrenochaeta sp. DS3sAY3a]